MHASMWTFDGDSDDLVSRYEQLVARIGEQHLTFHMCLRTPTGMMLVDTCPSQDAFVGFLNGGILDLLEEVGLPAPTVEDFPVHEAFAHGSRLVQVRS